MKKTQSRTPLWALARVSRRAAPATGGILTVVGNSWNPNDEVLRRARRDDLKRAALVGAYYCG